MSIMIQKNHSNDEKIVKMRTRIANKIYLLKINKKYNGKYVII